MTRSEPPTLLISARARPHEQLFLLFSLISGLSYLLGAPKPGSINALMPHWEIWFWSSGLAISGVVGLFGCWWKYDRGLGLGMEMAGMLVGAGAMLMYAAAAWSVGGWKASLPAGISLVWTIANLVRAGQIRKELRTIENGG